MVLITNFGDVTTTGNMTVSNLLTVQGAFIFASSIFTSGSVPLSIGNVASPFSQVFVTTLTSPSVNVANIYGPRGSVGIGTTNPGQATLFIQGNVFVSNAIQTTNLFVTTANVTFVNSFYIVAQSGSMGIGTTSPQGSNLYVQGNVFVSNALSVTNIFSTTINASLINTGSFFASSNIGIGAAPNLANLYVQGNVSVTNALTTTNIFASNLTLIGNLYVGGSVTTPYVTTLAANSAFLNVVSAVMTTNVGIGTSPNLANLYVRGNVFVSNALTTQNIFASSINTITINTTSIYGPSGFVGIGTTDPQGTSLYIQGNLFASNSITTTNIYATSANISYLNVAIISVSGSLGIGTAPGTTNLYVTGNMYVSNALQTTNVFAQTMNVSSLNVAYLYATSISAQMISYQTIYYGEDIFKRGPYLQPSPANASNIQAWISSTANASSQPTKSWWATSAAPTFGNVGTIFNGGYFGSLLLPDGRIMYVPTTTGTPLSFFNPSTGLGSSVPTTFKAQGLRGAVLVPNGNVVMIPWSTSSNVIVLNPISRVSSNIITGVTPANSFQGGVLSPTGNVILCPRASGNIGLVNPVTLTYTNIGPTFAGASQFSGAVLLPNGNVFFCGSSGANSAMYNTSCLATVTAGTKLGGNFTNIFTGTNSLQSVFLAPNGNVIGLPYSGPNIVSVNPLTFVSSNIPCGAASFLSGAMLPTGNLICCGSATPNIGMVDTVSLTFSNIPGTSRYTAAAAAGTTLYTDGRVFFVPPSTSGGNVACLSTMVPVDPAWCLSPYFNKL